MWCLDVVVFSSLDTTRSLEVLSKALMRTTSSVGDHLRFVLGSATISSFWFGSSVYCVLNDMSIICMFSVFIYHRFESSFISFITILYHFSSFLHTLHTYCISELFSGDLELFASKLEEVSQNQRTSSTPKSSTSSKILDPLAESL